MSSDSNISLGEFLRQERERRGITIEQVASATKIGVKLLHSLETDNYVDLPAKPFIRGFVISYARFIGLEPKETLSRFNDYIEKKAMDRPNRDSGHSGYAFERRDGEQSRTVLWIVMGTFLVLGGFVMIFLKPTLRHHKSSHLERLKASHTATPVAVSSPMPSATPALVPGPAPSPSSSAVVVAKVKATPFPSPAVTPSSTPSATPSSGEKEDILNSGVNLKPQEIRYKIIFKALVNVWVRYQVDDRQVMKFTLGKDRILVLRAANTVKFQSSNPKAVLFNFSGRGFKPLSDAKTAVARQNSLTLFLPPELAETTQEPFPNEKPLPSTPAPTPTPSPSLSTLPQ